MFHANVRVRVVVSIVSLCFPPMLLASLVESWFRLIARFEFQSHPTLVVFDERLSFRPFFSHLCVYSVFTKTLILTIVLFYT